MASDITLRVSVLSEQRFMPRRIVVKYGGAAMQCTPSCVKWSFATSPR